MEENQEKQSYYVSVQAKTILPNPNDGPYEFEIKATPREVRQLVELFQAETRADLENNSRALLDPEIIANELVSMKMVDQFLMMAYRLIHRLGTPETKEHIESMNVLDGIQTEASRAYQ